MPPKKYTSLSWIAVPQHIFSCVRIVRVFSHLFSLAKYFLISTTVFAKLVRNTARIVGHRCKLFGLVSFIRFLYSFTTSSTQWYFSKNGSIFSHSHCWHEEWWIAIFKWNQTIKHDVPLVRCNPGVCNVTNLESHRLFPFHHFVQSIASLVRIRQFRSRWYSYF